MATTKRPTKYKNDLAHAVFHSVYTSRTQRQRRLLAALILTTKHTLRGLLFSWPLYLMVVAGFYADGPVNLLLWALGVPGIAISISILARGICEEYRVRIAGQLLKPGDLLRVLRGGVA